MVDILISITAKIAEYTVRPILRHAEYLCCFNNFAEKLSNAKRNLELTRDVMKERTNEATNKAKKIMPTVENWLKDVKNILEEVQVLEERISKISNSCFRRQCQYSLAKDMARKTEKMIQLNVNSKFEPFSMPIELPGMKYYSSKDFVLFESTQVAYNNLMEALKDKSVCMIGLLGLGGSGKTTLATEVGKKAEELKLFDKVVMVTVSQSVNIRNLQEQIADKLNLEFKEKSDEARAQKLSQRLRGDTTLVILDDVWEILDFEALGIPFIENNKGCRVLLTTRVRDVCTSRHCQSTKIIELNILTRDEAWTLFKMYANIVDDSPDALKAVARKVADECNGLPIAIVTVGSTLKGKAFAVWESALSRLEDSKPLVYTKGLRSPNACLQLSYDNLTDESAKSFFLSCAIFPEDYEIDLEDLFRFGRGLGQSGTLRTMEKERKEFHLSVNILLDSCLLMHANNGRVKMHDMVRDVALWIASVKKGQTILSSTEMDSRILAEDEIIKDKRAISLWDVKNGQFPHADQLNCPTPTLELLLLHSSNVAFQVPNAYLERLKMLKFMAFITDEYTFPYPLSAKFSLPLPQSMESLENLHTLCLRGYTLGDISVLEGLKSLEILDLRGSSFKELPNGIVALKKLKLLDLYSCYIWEKGVYKVVERCLQLEELYLYSNPPVKDIPYNVSFSNLQRYVMICNEFYNLIQHRYILEDYRPSRVLSIDGFNASAQSFLSLPIHDLFQRAEYLQLTRLEGGYKNVVSSMDPKGMNQLIVLILQRCQEIEYLITNTNVDMSQTEVVFCSLVVLILSGLDSLREVFSSQCSLKNLQTLWIVDCKQLYNISFPRNSRLSNLKYITIRNCPKLISLMSSAVAQTLEQLESMIIDECSELKHMIERVEEGYAGCVSSSSHTSLMFPNLRILQILQCPRLKYILQEAEILQLVVTTFNQLCDQIFSPQLESLLKFHEIELSNNGIKGLFQIQIGEPESNREPLPLNMDLFNLCLTNLPELKFIWKGPSSLLRLQMLTTISVYGCLKLKTIFSSTITRSLPMLWDLKISNCEELEQIFDSSDAPELLRSSQQMCFPKLAYITVIECNKLKCLFYNFVAGHFPNLSELTIEECSQLEKVFAFAHEVDDGGQGTDRDGEQVLFRHLYRINLTSLPNFKEIHHYLNLPHGVLYFIKDCPKYFPSLYLHQVATSTIASILRNKYAKELAGGARRKSGLDFKKKKWCGQ